MVSFSATVKGDETERRSDVMHHVIKLKAMLSAWRHCSMYWCSLSLTSTFHDTSSLLLGVVKGPPYTSVPVLA